MRTGWGSDTLDCRFDVPPRFGIVERRMAGQALDAWAACGQAAVSGFDDNSLFIDDRAVITSAGAAVAATFGLAAGMTLAGRDGLAAEFLSACDRIALHPVPVPFEASLTSRRSAAILTRGVALPLFAGGRHTNVVQIVVSWREVLNRAATTRLRRELGAALRFSAPISAKPDPFSAKSIA